MPLPLLSIYHVMNLLSAHIKTSVYRYLSLKVIVFCMIFCCSLLERKYFNLTLQIQFLDTMSMVHVFVASV